MSEHYIIIGNGIAGVTAAEVLRSEDKDADITVIADDPFQVYYRPALKDYLAGRIHEDKLWARSTSFYQDQRIRFLAERVVGIQAGQHLVQLQNGQQRSYHRLLLACGAHASRLHCPGSELIGVTTLRTVEDYQAVQEHLRRARRIVVSGSGTLALETIETLRHRGFSVTHLIRKSTLWSEVLDVTASDLILHQEQRDGVDVRVGEEIAEILGKNGHVSNVITTSGARIACELVLIAIGVEPVIDFVKRSGIPCGRGVKVDQAMRTDVPDIYAAGDVLEIPDPLTGRKRVIGQWYPAVQQARTAAYSMLGLLDTNQHFPANTFYNATFLYGLDFASVGMTQIPASGQGYQELYAEPRPQDYRKILLKNGVPVGMLALGERQGVLAMKRAIDYSVNLAPVLGKLFDKDFRLQDWLDAQGVPPLLLTLQKPGASTPRSAGAMTRAAHEVVPAPRPPEGILLMEKQSDANGLALPEQKTLLRQTGVTLIGRQAGVSLLIDHASVSRRHAEIRFVDGHYTLCDLGSSNGTFINDVRLSKGMIHVLQKGDRIRFGKVSCKFDVELPQDESRTDNLSGKTRFIEHTTGFYEPGTSRELSAASVQPLLNADGSLLLPGAQQALSTDIVATLKNTPALVVLLQGRPQVFFLRPGQTVTLGREKPNKIVLPDMAVSRRHAEIFPGTDGFYVRDLDSGNGVRVNRARITQPYRLAHGDRILIGSTTMYFLHQSSSAPAGPSAKARGALSSPSCPTCGTAVLRDARYCTHCGSPLRQPVSVND